MFWVLYKTPTSNLRSGVVPVSGSVPSVGMAERRLESYRVVVEFILRAFNIKKSLYTPLVEAL
jgi:hypothetical protein